MPRKSDAEKETKKAAPTKAAAKREPTAKAAAKPAAAKAAPKAKAEAKPASKPVAKASATKAAPKAVVAEKTAMPVVKKPRKASVGLKVPAGAFYGTGRRKSSIARVWVFPGSGRVEINGLGGRDYLKRDVLFAEMLKPLTVLDLGKKYDVKMTAKGGGLTGQADAGKLGVARALVAMNETFRKALRAEDLLTRDSRIKERKKYGRKRARKGFQYRKR